jgi:hypothetical protein
MQQLRRRAAQAAAASGRIDGPGQSRPTQSAAGATESATCTAQGSSGAAEEAG